MKPFLWMIVLALGLGLAGGARAQGTKLSNHDQEIYRAAFKAAESGRWSQATSLASEARDRLLAKVVEWLHLARPSSGASFDEIAAFIKENPDWPWQNSLHERAEEAIPDDLGPSAVRGWLEANPAVSATGMIRYAEALLATGEAQRGTELLRKVWIEGNLGERQEQILMFKHHELIRLEDHVARLDRLLWSGQAHAAREMLRRVDKDHAALADARLLLQGIEPGVEAALRRVPQNLRDDPGLVFDRLRWRVRKDRDDEARENPQRAARRSRAARALVARARDRDPPRLRPRLLLGSSAHGRGPRPTARHARLRRGRVDRRLDSTSAAQGPLYRARAFSTNGGGGAVSGEPRAR